PRNATGAPEPPRGGIMRSRSFWASCRGWLLLLAAMTVIMTARGAVPDPRSAENRQEDDLLEGEIDAEDFLAWHLSSGPLGPARGAVSLGFDAFMVERVSGAEMGIMLVLELPLERIMHLRKAAAPLTATPAPPGSISRPSWLAGTVESGAALGI